MKRRFIIVPAVAAVSVLGYLAFRTSAPRQAAAPAAAATKLSPGRPAAMEPSAADGDAEEDVPPAMAALLARLDASRKEWLREHPRPGHFHVTAEGKWNQAAIGIISGLSTDEIRDLATLLSSFKALDEIGTYRDAVYFVWAAREPAAAREDLVARYEHLPNKTPGMDGMNVFLDQAGADFTSICAGYASQNPADAWHDFLNDAADPELRLLIDEAGLLPRIFELYAAKSPAEAWQQILTHTQPGQASDMVKGYLKGAPAGQDWLALRDELTATPQGKAIFPDWLNQAVALRWLEENPQAALKWYAAQVAEQSVDPFPDLGSQATPADPSGNLMNLLLAAYQANPEPDGPALRVLGELAASPEAPDQALVHSSLLAISTHMDWDGGLLGIVPQLREPAMREEAYLALVRATPQSQIEQLLDSSAKDDSKLYLDAVKELGNRLDLSPETRQEEEKILRAIKEQRAANREGDGVSKKLRNQ